MLLWEKKVFLEGSSIIIGIDEAGRGPIAGPVVAGAVILSNYPLRGFVVPHYNERIDDSKKLLPAQREKAFNELSKKALFGIGLRSHLSIDTQNILQATLGAMRDAVNELIKKFCQLHLKNEYEIRKNICLLVDGNIPPGLPYKTIPIVQGDSKSLSIAGASIVAKVTRDRIMDLYDRIYKVYGFSRHKGYATRQHLEAVKKYGACPIHRRSFAPIKG